MTLYYFNQAHTLANLQPQSVVVGTGNTAPAETDSAMASFLAGSNNRVSVTNSVQAALSPRYAQQILVFEYAIGAVVGNVAEAGLCLVGSVPTAATPILSRGLVVDGTETPTTVSVLADEFLRVTWRYRMFVPEDVAGSFNMTIDGVVTAFNYTVRAVHMVPAGATGWRSSSLSAFGSFQVGSDGSFNASISSGVGTNTTLLPYDNDMASDFAVTQRATSVVSAAYVADSKQRQHSVVWSSAYGNIGIRSVFICIGASASEGRGYFQILLDIPVTKISGKQFTFTFILALANL
jgi:hypothetical protein